MKIVLRDLYSDIADTVGTSLPDRLLEFAKQIGVDGFDIHHPDKIPGWPGYKEKEYLCFLFKLKMRLRKLGLSINSVPIPSPRKFLLNQLGGDDELDNICRVIKCIGEASIPMAAVNLDLGLIDPFKWHVLKEQKGGYMMPSFNLQQMRKDFTKEPEKIEFSAEKLWFRRVQVYERIVPIAEDYEVKLARHPPDPPVPDHLLLGRMGLLDWSRLLEVVPSECNGLLYCVGSRYESGVDVLEEIRRFGRIKKIFHVHFRNVRGTLPSAGSYEEVALDDGDMNMFKVLQTLKEVGYDGAICPDHVPIYNDDGPERRIGRAFAVGYIKALLSVLS